MSKLTNISRKGIPKGTFAKANSAIAQQVLRKLENSKPHGSHTTEEEQRKEMALADHIAGESKSEVERKYRLAVGTVNRTIKQRFKSVEDFYEFLEGCFAQNALLASAIFAEKAPELSAIQAAQAANIFGQRAVEVRKARLSQFKEAPLSVEVVMKLQQALAISTS